MDNTDFRYLKAMMNARRTERDKIWQVIESEIISEDREDAIDALVSLAYKVADL